VSLLLLIMMIKEAGELQPGEGQIIIMVEVLVIMLRVVIRLMIMLFG
jgi:hypothetical protein